MRRRATGVSGQRGADKHHPHPPAARDGPRRPPLRGCFVDGADSTPHRAQAQTEGNEELERLRRDNEELRKLRVPDEQVRLLKKTEQELERCA